MSFGQVNADVIGTSVAGSNLGAGNASIMKNRIINGAMVIDQRNAGASVTITNTGAYTYTLDRFFGYGSQASKFSVQQNAGSVTPPVGFTKYFGVTSLSAYTPTTTEQFIIGQAIEGFNVADLGWGTANAKTVTLSFQVYSSLTGTFGGAISNSAQNRSYPFSYTISSANTWTTISVTIAGDTTGTWLTTNGVGLYVFFGIGVGTTSSGTAGAWASGQLVSATGATSVVGTSGATFYITGVQLEVGSSATGFEYVNYQTSLANCQRYFNKINTSAYIAGVAAYNAPNTALINVTLPVTPRATPTISYTGSLVVIGNGTSITMSGSASSITTSTPAFVQFNLTATGIVANVPNLFYVSSGTVDFSSEL